MFRFFLCVLILSLGALDANAANDLPHSKEELAKFYRERYEANDCDGLMKLIYTKGLDASRLSLVREDACRVRRPIEKIAFEPVDSIFTKPIQNQGKWLSTTLPARESMRLYFASDPNQAVTSTAYPIGNKGGVFYVTALRVVEKP